MKLNNLKMNHDISYGQDTSVKMNAIKIPRGTLINAMLTVNVNEKEQLIKPIQASKINLDQSSIASPEKSEYAKSCESILSRIYSNAKEISLMCQRLLNVPQNIISSIKDRVKMCDKILDRMITDTTSFTKIKQEMITYFVPLKPTEGTMVIIMMRIDPGVDIMKPVLKFLLTTFGVQIMNTMGQLGIDEE